MLPPQTFGDAMHDTDTERAFAEAHRAAAKINAAAVAGPRVTALECCNVQVSVAALGPDAEGFAVSLDNDPDPFHFTKEQAAALVRMLEMLK